MESALEEIEFLALSENRVRVLQCLAEKRRTRSELAAETGASQATLSRVLGDFEERSWTVRDDGEYVATATGRLVADGVTDLLEIMETEGELREIVEYLPTHAMDFDLQRLADARITVPTQTRPNAPLQRLLDLLRESESVRAFSHAFNEGSLRVVEDRVTAGDQQFRAVLSRSAIEAVADDTELRGRLKRILRTETASIRFREEGIPLAVTIADETVHLLLRDESGVLQASLDTDDPAVHSWADDTYDHYWRTSRPLEPDDLGT
ncbi:helix-turn-helix transcriptional regulator [Natranaeroarchaeum sulfidigenes]|uniref:Transcriptional regulator, contains HTH domain n=1 Tax=Natranaeroarchaeum sulfidigenes TaxID=2784880 RepID=A0A897MN15_9EURY|nr:helix-turn-helix domain-containing protein [Natranaeroarchaeum sulfidigenes]QSG03570.1 Transcriptional regulator, contains HTH domain [Natranaeroarchaeum sulfidigenes]